jgi:hypothetical protein
VPVVSPLIGDYKSSKITSPVFDDIKKIGKIGIGFVLSRKGKHSYPLCCFECPS